jgi:hypothetical protein
MTTKKGRSDERPLNFHLKAGLLGFFEKHMFFQDRVVFLYFQPGRGIPFVFHGGIHI